MVFILSWCQCHVGNRLYCLLALKNYSFLDHHCHAVVFGSGLYANSVLLLLLLLLIIIIIIIIIIVIICFIIISASSPSGWSGYGDQVHRRGSHCFLSNLNKREFCNVVKLRYEWPVGDITSFCVCGE